MPNVPNAPDVLNVRHVPDVPNVPNVLNNLSLHIVQVCLVSLMCLMCKMYPLDLIIDTLRARGTIDLICTLVTLFLAAVGRSLLLIACSSQQGCLWRSAKLVTPSQAL